MAGLAVGLAAVVERRARPGAGIVAVRALPAVVVGRLVTAVAGLAVGLTSVVKLGIFP